MKMRRIAAGLLSFILLMGNSLTVYATQTDTVIQTVSGNETVSENDVEESQHTETVDANGDTEQTPSGIPQDYVDLEQDAQTDLQDYLDEKEVFAIVYLTDSYAVKTEPTEAAETVISIPTARTVQILGMDVEWKYQEKWEHTVFIQVMCHCL